MKEIYTCDFCHYLFEMSDGIDRCPDCGKLNIRPASEMGKDEYCRLLIEFGYVESTN